MSKSLLAFTLAAFLLSLLAVAAAGVLLLKSPEGPTGPPPRADEGRVADLEARLAGLERRPAATIPPAPSGVTDPGNAALRARIERLEATVAELEASLDETDARMEALAASPRPGASLDDTPSPEQVKDLRKVALDAKAEPRARLLAMRQLARVDGGRTLDTARAMKSLFESSEDESTRTGAVAMLEGLTDPELEPWMLEVLAGDRYSSTRESAVEVLSHFVGSQRVREALEEAAANDENHDVRAEARNSLDKLNERERNR